MRLYIPAHLLAISLLSTSAPLGAQSLADVARKEEERRKTTDRGKVYTNKDLGSAAHAGSVPVPAAAPAAASPAGSAGEAGKDEAKAGPPPGEKPVVKDQAYWSGRLKDLQGQLSRDQTLAEALRTRLNALAADFVNRDDPAQRAAISTDRERATQELDTLTKAIEQHKKAIADLHEEARRANVPPGWLR